MIQLLLDTTKKHKCTTEPVLHNIWHNSYYHPKRTNEEKEMVPSETVEEIAPNTKSDNSQDELNDAEPTETIEVVIPCNGGADVRMESDEPLNLGNDVDSSETIDLTPVD